VSELVNEEGERNAESGYARQLLIRETHAGVVLQRAARVPAGTESHPYAEGGSPSLHPAVTLVVEIVLAAAQRAAAVLQIADARHVVPRLENKSVHDRSRNATKNRPNRTVMNSSKSQGMSILSLHCLPRKSVELVPEVKIISCSGRDDPAPDPSMVSSELFADPAFELTAEALATFPAFVVAVVETALPIAPWKLPGPIRKESRVQG